MVLLVLVMLASPPGPWQVDAPALEAADRVIAGSMLPSDAALKLIGRNVHASLRYLRWGVLQPEPQRPVPLRETTPLLNALNELVLLPQAKRLALSDAQIEALWDSHGVAAEDALAIVGYPAPPAALARLFRQNNLDPGVSTIGMYLREFETIPNDKLIERACSLPYTDQLGVLIASRRDFAFDALVKAIPMMEKKFAKQKYWDSCYKAAIRAMMATDDSRLLHFNIEKLNPQQFTRSEGQPIPAEFPWVEWAFMMWEARISSPDRALRVRPR